MLGSIVLELIFNLVKVANGASFIKAIIQVGLILDGFVLAVFGRWSNTLIFHQNYPPGLWSQILVQSELDDLFFHLLLKDIHALLVDMCCLLIQRRRWVGIGQQLGQEDLFYTITTSKMLISSYIGVHD